MLNEGTIIAKATASGLSAISIIRISGVDSIKMVSVLRLNQERYWPIKNHILFILVQYIIKIGRLMRY